MFSRPYQIIRTCRTCRGSGFVEAPHCALCGAPLPVEDPWWTAADALLPCGHAADEALVPVQRCPACGGNGRLPHTLTPAEWRQFRRQRLLRRGFVLLLSLLFLLSVGLVIWRDPDYLCSGWFALLLGLRAWRLG